MSKKALGKGLGAFIPDEFGILKDERFAELEVEDVRPNPFQPRTKFDDQTIDELALSIKESGIVQPIIVVPEEDHYMIIVGERRWRAAQKAGLRKVPVLIRNIPKDKQLEISLIENIHREELNALEAQLNRDFIAALLRVADVLDPGQRLDMIYRLSRGWFFLDRGAKQGGPHE